jgi:hypothetical protein
LAAGDFVVEFEVVAVRFGTATGRLLRWIPVFLNPSVFQTTLRILMSTTHADLRAMQMSRLGSRSMICGIRYTEWLSRVNFCSK